MGRRASRAAIVTLGALLVGATEGAIRGTGVTPGRPFPRVQEHPITWSARVVDAMAPIRPGGRIMVLLAGRIPPGWHIYSISQGPGGPIPMTIAIAPAAELHLVGTIQGPVPIIAQDPNFGIQTETYEDSAGFRIPVAVTRRLAPGAERVEVIVGYQTCNARLCLPLASDTIATTVTVAGLPLPAGEGDPEVESPSPLLTAPSAGAAISVGGAAAATLAEHGDSSESLVLFLWLAATMGALSLLTPCVFPMVPITISYFSGREPGNRARAVRDAVVYAGGIVGAFTGLGLGLAALFGVAGLNRFAANPWLNLAIAALFAGFGLSLFGALDLALPSSVLTRLDALSRKTTLGRDGTTVLMGATFALTSFTCTAPFVGTLLVSATQGNLRWPVMGLLTFSFVFALPFVVLALVPQALARLPRSGEWMVSLKGVLAFVELAAAMKFLSNADLVAGWGVFTRTVVLVVWVILGAALTCYLLGVRFTRGADGAARQHWVPAVAAFAITAWLGTGLTGRRLGEVESFLPPAGANGGGVATGRELAWIVDDYPAALAQARSQGKLVLIDFTGYTCTNCRWMEANMFPRAAVRGVLQQFVRVRLFTDGREARDQRQSALQQATFHTSALPLYAIVDSLGVSRGTFLGMTRSTDEFVGFLSAGAATK